MNKAQLTKDIEEMKQRLASMEAELAKTESKVWEPKDGEEVYLFSGYGGISKSVYIKEFLEHYWLIGNVFRTEAEAIKERDKRLATMRVIRKLRELEGYWEADWKSDTQSKVKITYDHQESIFEFEKHEFYQDSDKSLYSTKEACLWVIDNMADDLRVMFDCEVE